MKVEITSETPGIPRSSHKRIAGVILIEENAVSFQMFFEQLDIRLMQDILRNIDQKIWAQRLEAQRIQEAQAATRIVVPVNFGASGPIIPPVIPFPKQP
jgi:hypothetical protein